MKDTKDSVIYWLFFSTNHLYGLEQMKAAMWKVDRTGGFEFSDKYCDQVAMFSYNTEDLEKQLAQELDGKTMTVGQIREYVLINTPAYLYKSALQSMRKSGSLLPGRVGGNLPTKFGDETTVVRIRNVTVPKAASKPADQPSLF